MPVYGPCRSARFLSPVSLLPDGRLVPGETHPFHPRRLDRPQRHRRQMGWGDPLVADFDPAKIDVDQPRHRRPQQPDFSHRRPLGRGHRPPQAGRFRADAVRPQRRRQTQRRPLPGLDQGHRRGNARTSSASPTSKPETVHSYGWYLRKYIAEAKSKGATPIVVSLIPRNIWKDGKIGRADDSYGGWARQAAEQEQAHFIDFNDLLADRYESLGQEKTAALFAGATTPTPSRQAPISTPHVMAAALRANRLRLGKHLLSSRSLAAFDLLGSHGPAARHAAPGLGHGRPGREVTANLAGKSAVANADEDGKLRHRTARAGRRRPVHVLEVAPRCDADLSRTCWSAKSGSAPASRTWTSRWPRPRSARSPERRIGKRKSRRRIIRSSAMFTAEWAMNEVPAARGRRASGRSARPETAGDFSAVAYFSAGSCSRSSTCRSGW